MVDKEYLKDSVLMAAIAAGYTFFLVLSGLKLAEIRADPLQSLLAAGIASGGAFFMFLAGRFLPGPPVVVPPELPPLVPP